ncbi:hypothetical protein [Flavobacterium cheniae]|uniref:YhhN-like protein n=1 Tax=Flavobacterium cheniae TaxID=295428 RepID=A0A562KJP2_9FLAO|nr:hypothetical protein [Flavobacterium cheniae]TDR26004.1 hypothetical protein C8D80_0795 [Flavobacterium cheniae]TWH95610.1 hypothetical protein IP97_01288 [Flavobacterium cheniae]
MVREIFKTDKNIDSRASVALYVYFISYICYLFFYRVYDDMDIAFIFKPIIVPSIAFAYFFISKSPKIYLNLSLFLVIFFADNLILLEEQDLKVFSTYLYLIAIGILFYYVIVDSQLFKKNQFLKKNFKYFIISYLVLVILYKVASMTLNVEFKEFFVVIGYIVMFLMVLILSIYNALRFKSIASRFLLLTILCLFFSDVFIALNKYYSKNDLFIYISCIIEIPTYYFLLKYLLHREK